MTASPIAPRPEEEIFDVVDAEDCVVDRQPRSAVHRLELRHRAVHVLVYNLGGCLFLQRRALTKDRSPNQWDSSASGHVASGETYEHAACRELEEELGVQVDHQLTPLFKIEASPATGHEFVWVYRTSTAQVLRPDPVEIIDGRWCSREEVTRWLVREPAAFTASFRHIWSRLHSD